MNELYEAESGGEENEWGIGKVQESQENREKVEQKSKDRQKKIKKVQKDEKKGRYDDTVLVKILITFLQNPYYDTLTNNIFPLIDKQLPSCLLVWAISLVYVKASHEIRKKPLIFVEKETPEPVFVQFQYQVSDTSLTFDDNTLDSAIKKRINEWVQDLKQVTSQHVSHVLLMRLKQLFLCNVRDDFEIFLSEVFIFFLHELNISISREKAAGYAHFITQSLHTHIQNIPVEEVLGNS